MTSIPPSAFDLVGVHPDTEPDFRAWYDTHVAATEAGRPDPPTWTYAECRITYGKPTVATRSVALIARDDGTPVGSAALELPLRDNLGLMMFEIGVLPRYRRRGYATRIFERIEEIARAEGRTSLLTELNLPPDGPPPPGFYFASRHGFTNRNTEVRRRLRLPVADPDLDRLAEKAADDAYRIIGWTGPCPEEYAEAYAHLRSLLIVDAPLGDIDVEPEKWDVQRLREEEAKADAMGRTIYTKAAVAGDGTLAGHTMIGVPADDDRAYQWDTLVLRKHRGHRLGLALKVANLRAMQAGHPGINRIDTWNAEQNGPMVAVNEQLGFEPIELLQEWQR